MLMPRRCAVWSRLTVGVVWASGERAATFYMLIRSARLNRLEPEAYLREVLTRIGEHPINRIDQLLPWNIARPATRSVAARYRDCQAAEAAACADAYLNVAGLVALHPRAEVAQCFAKCKFLTCWRLLHRSR